MVHFIRPGSWVRGSALFLFWIMTIASCHGQPASPGLSQMGELIATLSEENQYFDTDNLISNESSYLHVVSMLEAEDLKGGVYIGVGPGQNFSYLAASAPELAFIFDIRKDNVLLHLMHKALFTLNESRVNYLAMLMGFPLTSGRTDEDVDDINLIVASLDAANPEGGSVEAHWTAIEAELRTYGAGLEEADYIRVRQLYSEFVRMGFDLRFTSHNRPPQSYYPTYRELILERDENGRQASFLASGDRYRRIRNMQLEDRIIPVVGDLSGDKAVLALEEYLKANNLEVMLVYTSNVEFYLMMRGRFDQYATQISELPRAPGALMIRSYFNRYRRSHPLSQPGHGSTQLMQSLESFANEYQAGGYVTYQQLITKHIMGMEP